ncbi:MAG: DUF4248 domain-containing protein [Chitinophagales bacterium]|nr:DUF4248 domain-containing protein [Chitinophagales bacterium]
MQKKTNNATTHFELKSYSRKELAQMYFPDSSADNAAQNFRRWLNLHTNHQQFLKSIHRRRYLLKSEVSMIVELLGEP